MQNEKVVELTAKLEAGVKGLFESEKYKSYLETMSKFHNYSFNNSLLIAMQRPDASYVAGYNAWKNNFDRQVEADSKAIQIFQPAPFKTMVESEKTDANGNVILGSDGKPETETVEKLVPGFKVGYVYAYEDTTGTHLPEIVTTLKEDVQDYARFMQALRDASPVPIHIEKIDSQANGYYSHATQDIHVKEGMSELQTLKTTIHEVAHSILHNKNEGIDKEADNRTREVEAESVAYAVSSYYGLDTSDYSFGYIAGWSSDKDLKELKESMNMIQKATAEIIDKVDQSLLEMRMTVDIDELAYKLQDGYFYIQRTDEGYDYSILDRWSNLIDGGIIETGKSIDIVAEEVLREHGKDINFATLHDTSTVVEKIEKANEIANMKAEEVKLSMSHAIAH